MILTEKEKILVQKAQKTMSRSKRNKVIDTISGVIYIIVYSAMITYVIYEFNKLKVIKYDPFFALNITIGITVGLGITMVIHMCISIALAWRKDRYEALIIKLYEKAKPGE